MNTFNSKTTVMNNTYFRGQIFNFLGTPISTKKKEIFNKVIKVIGTSKCDQEPKKVENYGGLTYYLICFLRDKHFCSPSYKFSMNPPVLREFDVVNDIEFQRYKERMVSSGCDFLENTEKVVFGDDLYLD